MTGALKETRALKAIFAAARRLLKRWRVLAVLAAVYASLLVALFLFVATKEATYWQVMLTLIFAALAPALFFVLQAVIVNYARGETQALALLRRSFRDSCKLALASVPLALAAILCMYLLNKLQSYFTAYVWPTQPAQEAWPVRPRPFRDSSTPPLQWALLTLSTLRFLVFWVALPLAAIHLWSATLREGLLSPLRKVHHHLARAFAPDAVLIYGAGLTLFGLVPYLLLFTRTPASKPSIEFGLFVARLLLVFIFTLCGWVLTLDALTGAGNTKAEDMSGR